MEGPGGASWREERDLPKLTQVSNKPEIQIQVLQFHYLPTDPCFLGPRAESLIQKPLISLKVE